MAIEDDGYDISDLDFSYDKVEEEEESSIWDKTKDFFSSEPTPEPEPDPDPDGYDISDLDFGYDDPVAVSEPEPEGEEEIGDVSNAFRGMGARATELAGQAGTFATDRVAEAMPYHPVYGSIKKGYELFTGENVDLKATPVYDTAQRGMDYLKEADMGYEPRYTWERLKDDKSLLNAVGYIGETGLASLPDMLAAVNVYTLPVYMAARSQEIGEERAENKGKSKAELIDVIEASPFAIGSAIFERFAGKIVLDDLPIDTLTELVQGIGKATLSEAGTEAVQEGVIEYLGGKLGTDAEMSFAEAGDRALGAAVAGGGFGGGIRATTGSIDLASGPRGKSDQEVADEIMNAPDLDVASEIAALEADILGLPAPETETLSLPSPAPEPVTVVVDESGVARPTTKPIPDAEFDADAPLYVGPDGVAKEKVSSYGAADKVTIPDPKAVPPGKTPVKKPEQKKWKGAPVEEKVETPKPKTKELPAPSLASEQEADYYVDSEGNYQTVVRPDMPTEVKSEPTKEGQSAKKQESPTMWAERELAGAEVKGVTLPENLPDPRLKRENYRYKIRSMVNDNLVVGGDISVIRDDYVPNSGDQKLSRRTPSVNPEWYKNMDSDTKLPIVAARSAVDRALKGEKLGVKQARFVEAMLDTYQEQREGADPTQGDPLQSAKDERDFKRQDRRDAKAELTDDIFQDSNPDDMADITPKSGSYINRKAAHRALEQKKSMKDMAPGQAERLERYEPVRVAEGEWVLRAKPEEKVSKSDGQAQLESIASSLAMDSDTLTEVDTFEAEDLSPKLKNAVTLIEKSLGKKVVFFESKNAKWQPNGFMLGSDSDTIYINVKADRPLHVVMGHEILHAIKIDNPKAYERVMEGLTPLIENYQGYKDWVNSKNTQLGKDPLTDEKIREEMAADMLGDSFDNPKFWADLKKESPTLYENILQTIQEYLNQFVSSINERHLKGTEHFKDMNKARIELTKLVRQAVKESSQTTTSLDKQANEAATSITNETPIPTEAQIDAENYKKGHLDFQGLDVAIENPVGSLREGTGQNGKTWRTKMANHYGYIKRTEGNDGDAVDVFMGPNSKSTRVFVVNQVNPKTGAFDEHKVMLGFNKESEAIAAYKANYAKDWDGIGTTTPMSMVEFKAWLDTGDTKQPATKPEKKAEEQANIFDAKPEDNAELVEAWTPVMEEFNSIVAEMNTMHFREDAPNPKHASYAKLFRKIKGVASGLDKKITTGENLQALSAVEPEAMNRVAAKARATLNEIAEEKAAAKVRDNELMARVAKNRAEAKARGEERIVPNSPDENATFYTGRVGKEKEFKIDFTENGIHKLKEGTQGENSLVAIYNGQLWNVNGLGAVFKTIEGKLTHLEDTDPSGATAVRRMAYTKFKTGGKHNNLSKIERKVEDRAAAEKKFDEIQAKRDDGAIDYSPSQDEKGSTPNGNYGITEDVEKSLDELLAVLDAAVPDVTTETNYEKTEARIRSRLEQYSSSGLLSRGSLGIVESQFEKPSAYSDLSLAEGTFITEDGKFTQAEIKEQARTLIASAKEGGFFWDKGKVGDVAQSLESSRIPPESAGAEHDVFLADAGDGKVVIRNTANGAYGPTLDTSPAQYMQRLEENNEVFPEMQMRLIGVSEDAEGNAVIWTAQDFAPAKEFETEAELEAAMAEKGWVLEGSEHVDSYRYRHAASGAIIQDAHTGNILYDADGKLYPIDVMIEKLPTAQADEIQFSPKQEMTQMDKIGRIDNIKKEYPQHYDAIETQLNKLPKREGLRVRGQLQQWQGTPWSVATYRQLNIREMFDRQLAGESIADIKDGTFWSKEGKMDYGNYAIIKAFSHGEQGVLAMASGYDFLSTDLKKSETAFSGSFVNCNPSLCAKYCYATTGNSAAPAALVGGEFTEYMAKNHPQELMNRLKHYTNTPAGLDGLALRINEKGDLSQPMVKVIKALNKEGVRLQVFSRRPELLRQLSDFNWKALSIDSENIHVARENPDLNLAIVVTDNFDADFIYENKDRISVMLPVNQKGTEWSRSQIKEMFSDSWNTIKNTICPVDGGSLKAKSKTSYKQVLDKNIVTDGLWTCLTCDSKGNAGCYHGDRKSESVRKAVAYIEASESTPQEKLEMIDAVKDELKKQYEKLKQAGVMTDEEVTAILSGYDATVSKAQAEFEQVAAENRPKKYDPRNESDAESRSEAGSDGDRGRRIDTVDINFSPAQGEVVDLLNDPRVNTGIKIPKNVKLWRGVSERSGEGFAVYGLGEYTTTSKTEAALYGDVVEMGTESLPDNPLRFDTVNDYEIWLSRVQDAFGIAGNRSMGEQYPEGVQDFIRKLDADIDGLQIGKGNDAIIVAWPVDESIMYSPAQEPSEEDLLQAILDDFDTQSDAINIITDTPPKSDFQGSEDKGLVGWNEERLDSQIRMLEAPDDLSRGQVGYVNPLDFVYATSTDPKSISDEAGDLDLERLGEQVMQTPFLFVEDGQIVGHEGRHRLMALAKAGYTRVPIVVEDKSFDLPKYKSNDEAYQVDDLVGFAGQDFRDGSGIKTESIDITFGHTITSANKAAIQEDMSESDLMFSPAQDDVLDDPDNWGDIEFEEVSASRAGYEEFLRRFVDYLQAPKKTQKAIEKKLGEGEKLSDDMNFEQASVLMAGAQRAEYDDFIQDEFEPFRDKMDDAGLSFEQAGEFLHARHAKEANAHLKIKNPGIDALSGMTNERAKKIIDRFNEKYGDVTAGDIESFSKAKKKAYKKYKRLYDKAVRTPELNAELEKIAREGMSVDQAKSIVDQIEAVPHQKRTPSLRNKLIVAKRLAEGNIADNDGLSGMSNERADEILNKYKDNEKAQEFGAMNDAMGDKRIDYLVEQGLISEQEAQSWKDNYDHYVPLQRQDVLSEGLPNRGSRGFDVRGRPVRLRAGSKLEVDHKNMMAHIVAQHGAFIVKANKNKVVKALYNLAKAYPDPSLWRNDYLPPGTPQENVAGEVIRPATANDPSVTSFKQDGENVYLWLNKEHENGALMIRALAGMNKGADLKFVRVFAALNRMWSQLSTTLSPPFVIRNFVKDIQSATYNLTDTELESHIPKVIGGARNAISAIRSQIRGDASHPDAALFEEYRRAGGLTGWMQSYENIDKHTEEMKREISGWELGGKRILGRKQVGSVFKLITDYNTIMENAVRFSAYKVAREELGLSPQQAAKIGKELTVDFNRKGEWGSTLNSFYMFWNAGVQGSARSLRAGTNPKNKRLKKMMAATVGFAAALELYNQIMSAPEDEDDESAYNKIRDQLGGRYLIVMTGNGEDDYFSVPLPWGYNVLHLVGQMMAGPMTHALGVNPTWDASHDVSRVAFGAMKAFNPMLEATAFQSLTPTAGDPFMRINENVDWHGGPVYPNFSKTEPNYKKYYSSASETSKLFTEKMYDAFVDPETLEISKLVDWSPEWTDMGFDFLTGGAGKFFLKDLPKFTEKIITGETLEPNEIPFLKDFKGKVGPSVIKSDYYEKVYSIKNTKSRLNAIKSDEGYDEYVRAYEGTGKRADLFHRAKASAKLISKQKNLISIYEEEGNDKMAEKETELMLQNMREFSTLYNTTIYGD